MASRGFARRRRATPAAIRRGGSAVLGPGGVRRTHGDFLHVGRVNPSIALCEGSWRVLKRGRS